MLPGSSPERVEREAARGKQSGRTQEIQRLIGRSLRAVTDLRRDARHADHRRLRRACRPTAAPAPRRSAAAGSRCTTRARRLVASGALTTHPVLEPCAAISVGMIDGTPMLDLEYSEDVRAEIDMNVVMTGVGPLRRGAGHRRRARVHARRARRVAEARRSRASPRSSPRSRRWSRSRRAAGRDGVDASLELVTLPLPLVLATGNTDKAREIIEILVDTVGRTDRRAGRSTSTTRRSASCSTGPTESRRPSAAHARRSVEARCRRDRCDARGERTDQGECARRRARRSPRSPTTPASRSTRSTARPASTRRATPGRRRRYADNVAKLLDELGGAYPTLRTARFATVAMARWPDGREIAVRGEVEGSIAAGTARASTASATTRCSCRPKATVARLRR